MLIKKLTNEETDEGLTLEMANACDLQVRHSPVLFKKDDSPASLVRCSTGWWAKPVEGDSFFQDADNKIIVFSERICQVARARYLLYFAKEERDSDVKELMQERKQKARQALDKLKNYIDTVEQKQRGTYINEILLDHPDISPSKKQSYLDKKKQELLQLPKVKEAYAALELLYQEDRIIDVLDTLGIEKIREAPGIPMLSVDMNDEKGMEQLKEMIGANAISSADWSIDKVYAQIKVFGKHNP